MSHYSGAVAVMDGALMSGQPRMKRRMLKPLSTPPPTGKSSPKLTPSQSRIVLPTIDTEQYLFADSHAFNRLRLESGFSVTAERQKLVGYEMYIVEQWICERRMNSTVTSYTGNADHHIIVNVLAIPKDRSRWSPLVSEFFDDIFRLHLRPKETELGKLFVTNLLSFPSNLNLVTIPTGDAEKAMYPFMLNEGLRRAGCGGRALLSVGKPSDASESKFGSLFKIHGNVPISFAVIEVITLVQISLFYCGLLEAKYVDGLLCNYTAQAISAWWDKWGRAIYHTRPNEAILGPSTVAGLIGFITGIRARLSAAGAKPPKDPFDAYEFLICLKHFQQLQNLPRVAKIDNETYYRLISLTGKNSSNIELLGMMRSAMKEVSGKTVQNVGDAETLDLDRLITCVQGPRSKYLWTGKGQMKLGLGPAHTYCQHTGIPLSALVTTDEHGGGNLDFGRNMIRSVVPHRRQKSDSLNRAISTPQPRIGRSVSPNLGYAAEPEIFDMENGQRENVISGAEVANVSSPMLPEAGNKVLGTGPPIQADNKSQAVGHRHGHGHGHGHIHRHNERRARLRKRGHYLKEKYFANSKQYLLGDEEEFGSSDFMPGEEEYIDDVGSSTESEDDMISSSTEVSPLDYLSLCQNYFDDIILSWRPCESISKRQQLMRSYSFGRVEEIVNKREVEPNAPYVISRSLYRIAYYHKQLDEQHRRMKNATEKQKDISAVFDEQIKQGVLAVDRVQYRLQTMSRKEAALKSQIVDLDTISARLQYETRMLQGKMRDVEEAVDGFADKVKVLENRMASVTQRREERNVITCQLSNMNVFPCLFQKLLEFSWFSGLFPPSPPDVCTESCK